MMVRQRSDPLGTATALPGPVKLGRDPDAEIIRSSSEIISNDKSTSELHPFETRHVVDEIREDSELEATREDSLDVIDLTKPKQEKVKVTPETHASSWFELFDWTKEVERDAVAPTTNLEAQEKLAQSSQTVLDTVTKNDSPTKGKTKYSKSQELVIIPEKIQREPSGKQMMVADSSAPETAGENDMLLRSGNEPVSDEERQMQNTDNKADALVETSTVSTTPTTDTGWLCCASEMMVPEISHEARDAPAANTDSAETTLAKEAQSSFLASLYACVDPTIAASTQQLTKEHSSPPKDSKTGLKATLNLPDTSILDGNTTVDGGSNEEENKLLESTDLASIPSVHEDVAESVAPIRPGDLGPTNRPSSPNAAALVEKKVKEVHENIEEIKLPTAKLQAGIEEASTTSALTASTRQMDATIEARRLLLVRELRSSIQAYGRYNVRCADVSAALGDVMDEAQEYRKAIKLHKDAVAIYSCKLGDDHSTTLNAKIRLGAVLEHADEIDEAIHLYFHVVSMRRAIRGDFDPTVADGLVCMAHALRKRGEYLQSIKELKRALKVYRQSLGDSHDKVAATVDEIASLYITIRDFTKAAAILEEVVKLKAATMGPKSKDVAKTLTTLANSYECSEKYPDALKALKKAYKIYSENNGYSCVDATKTLNRMARLYETTNDFNRAAVAYLGVLRSRKIHHGPDHIAVGETYYYLGKSLRKTGQFEKALKCLKEALPIFVGQGVEINDIKMVADIMHEMALTNQDRGNLQDAVRIFKQELSVRRKIGQPDFPYAARTLKHLGVCEYKLKGYSRASKYLLESANIYKERGDQGLEFAEVLYYTGLVFRKVNNRERAHDAYTEAIRMFVKNNADEDLQIFRDAKNELRILDRKNRPNP